MKNLNTKLENFLDIKAKHERMEKVETFDKWGVEFSIEKFKPLLDDGFDGNDVIEYFTVKLIDYIHNKYQYTEDKE